MWTHPEAHPGEFLRERFLVPLGLSAAALAAGCRMPRSRVSDLLAGKRRITADTAHRLGAFFRMEPEQWLALQAEWDLSEVEPDRGIVPLDPPGFLLGPLGATPLPTRRPQRPTLFGPAQRLATSEQGGAALAADGAQARYEARTHEEVVYPDGTRAWVTR